MPGDDAFRFRHLLIRDAAYDSLPKETRADLHERFALWIEEHVQLVEQDEIVGYHAEQAVLYRRELGREDEALAARAAERLGAAGQRALQRGDNYAAVSLLERAVRLLPDGDTARLELVPDLVLALIDVGRISDAQSYVDELSAAGEPRWEAYATTLRPVLGTIGGTGSLEAARHLLPAAEKTFHRIGDERGLAVSLLVQGHDEWTRCRASAAAEKYRAALPHAERAKRSSIADEAIANLCSIAAFGPTHVDEAEHEIRALVGHATSVNAETAAYRSLGRLAAIRGDFEAGRDLIRRGREPLLDAGLVIYHAASSMGAAAVEERAGELERAERILREGFDRLAEIREHAYASTVAAQVGHVLLQLGRDDEAAKWVSTARELCPPGDVGTLVSADLGEGLLRARQGSLVDAERLVRRGAELAETTDFWEYRGEAGEALAHVLSVAGRTAEARAALQHAIEIYEAKGASVVAERARGLLAQL